MSRKKSVRNNRNSSTSKFSSASSFAAGTVAVDANIKKVIQTDNRPGLIVPVTPNIPANITKEYISGGSGFAWWGQMVRALPHYIDDLTADFGDDLYERMSLDSQIKASVTTIKLSALANGYQVQPAIEDETDPKFEQATQIAEFAARQLDNLPIPFLQTLYELLDALVMGHKVAEKVFEIDRDPDSVDVGKLVLKSIKVKPRRATALVVDAFFNVLGIEARLPGGVSDLMTGGGFVLDSSGSSGSGKKSTGTLGNLLPREKVIIYTNMPKDNDPRGTSILRPAYQAWWHKQQMMPEYRRYLAQFAVPSLIAKTPPGAQPQAVLDPVTGLQKIDPITGQPQFITPEQAMQPALENFENGSYLIIPGESEVTPISSGGDGSAFLSGFSYFNDDIVKSILLQLLATSEGTNMSRAASQTHQDVLDMLVRYVKISLAAAITRDLLYWLVLYNFGPAAAKMLCPTFVLPETEQHNFAEQAAAIAQLQSSGYLHPTQQPGIDSSLNLPPRDTSQDNEQKENNAVNNNQQITTNSAVAANNTNNGEAVTIVPSNIVDTTTAANDGGSNTNDDGKTGGVSNNDVR